MKIAILKRALILWGAGITTMIMASCSENEIMDTESAAALAGNTKNLNHRMMASPENTLVIHNNSDFNVSGIINCYGALQNTTVQDTILIQGPTGEIRSGYSITYSNFAEQDSGNEIDQWQVFFANEPRPFLYSGEDTQELFGELLDHNDPDSGKFANWEYLKLTLSNYSGDYFTGDVQLDLELPFFSSNNTGEQVFWLGDYGDASPSAPYLHVHYQCGFGANGEISVKIFNEVTAAP